MNSEMKYSYDFERCFDYVWQKIVLPSVELVHEEIDKSFAKETRLNYSYIDISKFKSEVKDFYYEKREWLKKIYLPHEKYPFIDSHKIAAIWARTMLAYKPFYFDVKCAEQFVERHYHKSNDTLPKEEASSSSWFIKNVYCNYRVAFLVSVGIVYLFLLYDCKEKHKFVPAYLHDSYEYFLSKKGLHCPKTVVHSPFDESCIIALQKNDVLGRDFDYLAYAIILFQLEHYNKMCYYMQQNQLSISEF